jgi:hypothetical protein
MGHIQLLEYMSGQTLEGEVSDWLPPAFVPDPLAGRCRALLSMLVISEDLPMPTTGCGLTPTGASTSTTSTTTSRATSGW